MPGDDGAIIRRVTGVASSPSIATVPAQIIRVCGCSH